MVWYLSISPTPIPYSAKFGEFGETIVIRQYFTQSNSTFTIVSNGSYCKFINVFLAKTLKWSIRLSFTPPKFCAIRVFLLERNNTRKCLRIHQYPRNTPISTKYTNIFFHKWFPLYGSQCYYIMYIHDIMHNVGCYGYNVTNNETCVYKQKSSYKSWCIHKDYGSCFVYLLPLKLLHTLFIGWKSKVPLDFSNKWNMWNTA